MSEQGLWLIVRQRPAPHPELDELVAALHRDFRLDLYTTRQNLLGPGVALLSRGAESSLAGPVATLRRHGYRCWTIRPPSPSFTPPRLRSLAVTANSIDLLCENERRVHLERGMAAVGVLADISGELAGRQVKRLLARNAYLGSGQARPFTPEELRQEILKGQPVFDSYLLAPDGTVTAAFRAFPGRFNPEGLGGRAGLSAARNLEALADLVSAYAGRFRLHTDFGLSQLPGCQPQPAKGDPALLLGNLDALTRYGWTVAALGESPGPADELAGAPGAALAAGLVGMATAAGGDFAPVELTEIAAAVDEAAAERPHPAPAAPAPQPLPPPPERPERPLSLQRVLPVVGLLAGGALLVGIGRTTLLRPALDQAVHSGLLPALLAGILCWGGYVCLRIKRFVEDTPTSRIRSLAMGLVEVRGRATRRHALVSPMTQSACVWYRLRRYRRDGSDRWTLTGQSDSAHVPFLLDDGGGRVVVDPAGATVKAGTRETGFPGESSRFDAAVEGGADEKWVEEMIYEGTTLYVLGYARPLREASPGLRERTVERLRRLKLDPRALRRYDTDGDGRLDESEWQSARAAAEETAAAEQLNEQAASGGRHVVLGRPPRGLPFLIAEGETGSGMARRYGWFAGLLFAFGLVAAVTALVMSLKFFGLT